MMNLLLKAWMAARSKKFLILRTMMFSLNKNEMNIQDTKQVSECESEIWNQPSRKMAQIKIPKKNVKKE